MRGRVLGLLVVAVALFAFAVPAAHAGTYTVKQCDGAGEGLNPQAQDAAADAPWAVYSVRDQCEGPDSALKVNNIQATTLAHYGVWRYVAPLGTQLTGVQVGAKLVQDGGHRPVLYVSDGDGSGSDVFAQDDGSNAWGSRSWTASPGLGRSEFGVRLRCSPASGGDCPESGLAAAWIRNVRLTVSDTTAPTLALGGALASGGWQSGSRGLTVAAADAGGGLRKVVVEVNGTAAAERTFDCEMIAGSVYVRRLQPCAASQEVSLELDTSTAPFHDGTNTVQVCAEDFADAGANRTCTTRTVRVDNEAPAPPQNLTVVGGSDWRYVNDFDVTWENPEEAMEASDIDGAFYRFKSEAGEAGPVAASDAAGIDHLNERHVPAAGTFRLFVWLRDEAGNASEASAADVTLRFDDQAPGPPTLHQPSGWLSRRELAGPFVQRWSAPAVIPVSGLRGYGVAVDSSATTNPCDTQSDSAPNVCSDAELTHLPAERAEPMSELPEGSTFVHVATASGARLRSDSVAHVELKIDRTDPETELIGAPAGWTNEPVTLVAHAEDTLSGMAPVAGDDGAPYTALQIDGATTVTEPDNEVTVQLSEEGDHAVRFWARDLAGNANDGDPGGPGVPANAHPESAHVKIDQTAPTLAFANSQDPADPELVRVHVTESLSGVESGRIYYRGVGDPDWIPLVTEVTDTALGAKFPSEQLADGMYELRAEASDRAGNSVATIQRADGSAMELSVPLKVEARLMAGLRGGQDRATVGYGHPSKVSGRLTDAAGRPLAGEEVEVTERFADGSTLPPRLRAVSTDAAGRFAMPLPPGTSRTLEVSYDGSPVFSAAEPDEMHLSVEGAARLKSSDSRTRVGQRFRFSGRVKHLGARVPARGKLVELQVKRPEGWDTVRQAFRTEGNGSWRFPFRFGNYYAKPTSFRFRLKVPHEGGWPYAKTTTHPRRVTVVPKR